MKQKHDTAGDNLALAENPSHYKAVSKVFDQLSTQIIALEAELRNQPEKTAPRGDVEHEVKQALAGFDCLLEQAKHANDLSQLTTVVVNCDVRVYFRFVEVQWKNRKVNRCVGGHITFGPAPPPVPLYTGPTGRRALRAATAQGCRNDQANAVLAGVENQKTNGFGESLGNVNRGERI